MRKGSYGLCLVSPKPHAVRGQGGLLEFVIDSRSNAGVVGVSTPTALGQPTDNIREWRGLLAAPAFCFCCSVVSCLGCC